MKCDLAADKRGVDLISDVLPFGQLWIGCSGEISFDKNHAP